MHENVSIEYMHELVYAAGYYTPSYMMGGFITAGYILAVYITAGYITTRYITAGYISQVISWQGILRQDTL